MGRKSTFLDEENIPASSKVIYCFTPFEKPDDSGKFVFKVGKSRYFGNRLESFHTDYVDGVFLLRVLELKDANRREHKIKNFEAFLSLAEKQVFDLLQQNGAKRLRSQTRVKQRNEDGGVTEWFYGSSQSIHRAFQRLHSLFGGILHTYTFQNKATKASYDERKEIGYSGETIVDLKFV